MIKFPKSSTESLRPSVINAISNCERIIVCGPPNDYYKIYFFSDTYRYYKVELKYQEVPKRFSEGGKKVFDKKIAIYGPAVDRTTALQILNDCPYEQVEKDHPVLKPTPAIFGLVKTWLSQ